MDFSEGSKKVIIPFFFSLAIHPFLLFDIFQNFIHQKKSLIMREVKQLAQEYIDNAVALF